jgi:hypothetical protein
VSVATGAAVIVSWIGGAHAVIVVGSWPFDEPGVVRLRHGRQ